MDFPVQPEQAQLLLSLYLTWMEMEWPKTRTVIEAIPEDKLDYRPDPKARTALGLAWHIAVSEAWFLEAVVGGEFSMDEPSRPRHVATTGDVIAWYETNVPPLMAKTRDMPPDRLAGAVSFFGMYNYPAVMYLAFLISHTIHHRGQLSTYLRPMGSKVPSIYGGSADEPFEISAG